MDTSESVESENFEKVRQFLKIFAGSFKIGNRQVLIGVSTFDSVPRSEFWLKDNGNNATLQAAIDAIVYQAGGTLTSDALDFVRNNAFERVGKINYTFTKSI